MLEKRQENEPVRERGRTAKGEADRKRLLALNLPQRGGAICTKGPPAFLQGSLVYKTKVRSDTGFPKQHNPYLLNLKLHLQQSQPK